MSKAASYKKRYIVSLVVIFMLILGNHVYYQLLSPYIGLWALIVIEVFVVAIWAFFVQKRFYQSYIDYIDTISESSPDTVLLEELSSIASPFFFPAEAVNKIIQYQNNQKKKQQALLEQLKSNNMLLEQNNRITDSIIQITSEILSSGEINEVLQTILDKAIEIIPNAQKGSILIYNGSNLEYRAVRGYDFEVLKNLKLGIEEIFQYNSKDFYEPCIIRNPENFNRERLETDKFEMLRDGRGFELKSILSCAIQVDNEFYGIINLDCIKDKHAFKAEDKPLIKHLAAQIGIALKNAKLIERILYLSRHDSLTGIYNRCYFEELLMRNFQQCAVSDALFSLALVDINDLKTINDTYGHEAGDLLLRKFAQGVKESMQADDIFTRYGGDEFAIIFTGKSKPQSEEIMNKIRSTFAETPFTYCGKEITTISFGYGITEFPTETNGFEELLRLADSRMYKEKKKSKKPIR